MTQPVNRVSKGVPSGGQFAATRHGEPAVALTSPARTGPEDWGRARREAWDDRFNEVLEYIADNGAMPTHNPSRPQSKRLAGWLNEQRRFKDDLPEFRARLLDEHLPGWRDPRDAAWQARLDEVRAYRERHGRLPAAGKESNEVSSYGRWLVYQRKNEDRLPEHRIRALDALDRDWRDPNPLSWAKNVDRAAAVVERLGGKFPTSGSSDPEEHRVAEWLSSQRTHRSRMTNEQIRELDERLPGWNRGREQVWKERLRWTSDFLRRNRRFPSQHSANLVEASHAAWVRAQRRSATKLTEERERMLNEMLPGWRR
ncbi:helicase associated domain-containing protein [Arthrobacter caoxuetaonis]|uniref:Helicase associated domain-containing protein n=1 Tax=Arthrobacter caoxuetaonis TaxID=2886935 RepID=A0A9X1MFW6_9MICC|nr:helicase associated domain-containing protein [Arthrobacter caoxuetaonis]MCC3299303.1 helicase associated domain-containing protein [Arthrobacter caoxuetaonis]USQ59204.1 helicase associated domain-containing protein [Arthrobacter caoxuetaonis]